MPDDALYDLLAPPPLISLTIKMMMMMMMMTIVAVEYGMQLMIASAIYTKKKKRHGQGRSHQYEARRGNCLVLFSSATNFCTFVPR